MWSVTSQRDWKKLVLAGPPFGKTSVDEEEISWNHDDYPSMQPVQWQITLHFQKTNWKSHLLNPKSS